MPPFSQDPFSQRRNNTPFERAPNNPEKLKEVPVGDDRYLVEREQSPKFNFDAIYEKFKNPQGGLIFTKILSLFPHVPIRNDDNNWHGVTRSTVNTETREETVTEVVIGTQKVPQEIAKIFGWGVESTDHEFAVKASHEIAHVYQMSVGFQHDLIRSKTEGATFKPAHKELSNAVHSYIYLYDMLDTIKSSTGKPVTGLASLSLYHAQTAKNEQNVVEWGHSKESALDQQIMEDITELMGAYALGEDYFNFRLNNMNIAEGQKSTVKNLIQSILP